MGPGGCHPAGGLEQRLADQRQQLPDPLGVQPLERVERGWLRDALRSVHHFGCNLHVGSGSASVPGVLQEPPGPQYESGQIRWDGVERKNSELKANARKDLRL